MATLAELLPRLRLELGDPPMPFQARVLADGVTDRFDLPVELVEAADLRVFSNGVILDDDDYEIDHRAGVLVLPTPPGNGVEIVVEGRHYETFLPEDLEGFIETAFLRHAHGRENALGLPLTLDELPPVEEYLVVILAQIDALWSMITDAAQEIDVRSPDGVTIPVGQRYQQLLGLLQLKKRQYEELAMALNVGLHSIEMFTLRRVSRTTNRLVPIYKPQEYDAISKGFLPDYGVPGTEVVIRGDRFTGATEVSFNGTPATEFEVVNDDVIRATVPAGATTGRITITTPYGVGVTNHSFVVGQGPPRIPMGISTRRVLPPIDDGHV